MAKNQFTPLQTGKLCPFNTNEWEEYKKKWNCPDPDFYHCIPNQYNVPGQICVKPNWASKNYCPIFNTAANDIDLIPCDLRYGACSDTDYRSNKVYLYPGCLNKTSHSKNTPSTDGSPFKVSLPEIIIPVIIVVILLTIGIVYLIKRNKTKEANKSAKRLEMQPLLETKGIPVEFRRTVNYLNADVFVLTETYRRAVGILETQGWITLIGPPGSGKTMIAIQLAKRKLGCSGSAQGRRCTFHFCKSLSEISGLSNAKIEPYIILDDFMEQYRYYPSKLSEDKDIFGQIFKEFINTGLVHVILTIKEDTWEIFSKDVLYLEIFKSDAHLNLKEKPLTAKEKECMLRNHLRINHIDVATNKKEESLKQGQEDSQKMNIIQDIVTDLNVESAIVIHKDTIQKITRDLKDDFTFSVPVIIDLMCVNRYMMKNRDHILSKTFRETLKIHVTKWMKSEKDDDKKSICVVLFVGLCGGVVSLDDFHRNIKGRVYANVCKKYKVEPCDRLEVENMMKKNARVRAFVYSETNTSDTYTFHHDSLLDFFLFYVCADDENFFIENADIDYILSRCSLPEEKIKQRIAKTIGPTLENVELKAIDKLVDRIRVEIEHGHSIPIWKNHVFRNHETFNNKWNNVSSASNCEKSNTIGGDPRVEDSEDKK